MDNIETASKSHDIQVALQMKTVPEFELIPKIGMMVNLSIHLRGLASIEYEKLRLIAAHFFNIPSFAFKDVILNLEAVEFVEIIGSKLNPKKIIPKIPFFDNIYEKIGGYATTEYSFNEQEQLALKILTGLSKSPTERSNIFSFGAEKKIIERSLKIGDEGGYIINKRARGKDILISPLFFAENADVFLDMTAKAGATQVQKVLETIKKAQGWPLSIIEKTKEINGVSITDNQLGILKSLASDGAIKPPTITTKHAGKNNFIFTPAPGASKLNPTNREIYERAMSLVSSVRQGQLLSQRYPIWSPRALLSALRRNGYLKSTSETYAQYHQLAVMKVGKLVHVGGDRYQFHIINSEENMRALDLAIELISEGNL